jgi:hypothetical protein
MGTPPQAKKRGSIAKMRLKAITRPHCMAVFPTLREKSFDPITDAVALAVAKLICDLVSADATRTMDDLP